MKDVLCRINSFQCELQPFCEQIVNSWTQTEQKSSINPNPIANAILDSFRGTDQIPAVSINNETIFEILQEFRPKELEIKCFIHNSERRFICLDTNCQIPRQINCIECYETSHKNCETVKVINISHFIERMRLDFETPIINFEKMVIRFSAHNLKMIGEKELRRFIKKQIRQMQNLEKDIFHAKLKEFSFSLNDSDSIVVRNVQLDIINSFFEKILEILQTKNQNALTTILKEISRFTGFKIQLVKCAKNLFLDENNHVYLNSWPLTRKRIEQRIKFSSKSHMVETNKYNAIADVSRTFAMHADLTSHSNSEPESQNNKTRQISKTIRIFENQKTNEVLEVADPNDYLFKIAELEQKNSVLREEIDKLKNANFENEQVIKQKSLNDELIQRLLQKSSLENCLVSFSDIVHSTILNIDDLMFINKCFQTKIGLRLLYKSSRDGNSVQQFHQNCDKKGPTITFIKSGDFVAGGYNDFSWTSEEQVYKASSESFLFSLNRKRQYLVQSSMENKAIYCNVLNGPCFGVDLCVSNQIHSKLNYSHANRMYDFSACEFPNEELFGSLQFEIDDYEVYQVYCLD